MDQPNCGPSSEREPLTHLFFSDDIDDQAEARALCYECPLRAACLQKALDRDEGDGIWGGFSPVERKLWVRFHGDVVPEDEEIPEIPVELYSRGAA